ncbi:MAG: ribonuclease R family protein, partial [Fusobacteriaceae bacterium]
MNSEQWKKKNQDKNKTKNPDGKNTAPKKPNLNPKVSGSKFNKKKKSKAKTLENSAEKKVDPNKLEKIRKREEFSSREENNVVGELCVVKDRFAFVDTESEGIFIPRREFGGAFDGDTVRVQVVSGEGKKKEGKVVEVIKRNRDTIVGTIDIRETFAFVSPVHSFGNDIFIAGKSLRGKIPNGSLVVVKINFWGDAKKSPEGEILEVLGNPDDTDNMIRGLIVLNNMSETFPDEVLAEARNISTVVSKEEISKRKDLRDKKIITIDGDDAKDLDDAVCVEKLSGGDYKLIVSIADVSHYIPVNSALDVEAEKRGNSVYLVDRVLPMFPHEISNGICSLNEKEDKLTFSCEIIFDSEGKVKTSEMYKSVINTVHRMTYNNVNKILAKDSDALKEYSDITDEVNVMLELSGLIRKIKYNRGSIDFEIPEAKVILDKNKDVIEVKKIERGESERIIEDFMIAANEAIAEKLFWLEVPSIYRTHDKPDMERIQILNEILGKFDYRIKGANNEVHPKEFQKIIEDSKDKG